MNKYFKLSGEAITDGARPFATTYRKMGSNTGQALQLPASAYARLKSGEAIDLMCETLTECVVTVDVNSTDGPNIGGRDLFHLNVQKYTNKITDYLDASYCGGYEKQEGENEVIYQLKHISSRSGAGCYARLLQDNWEMKY